MQAPISNTYYKINIDKGSSSSTTLYTSIEKITQIL